MLTQAEEQFYKKNEYICGEMYLPVFGIGRTEVRSSTWKGKKDRKEKIMICAFKNQMNVF